MPKKVKTERIGERKHANNGQMVEIIDYKGANDITVRFEDGTELSHRSYKAFVSGELKNPNIPVQTYTNNKRDVKDERVGETIMSTSGIRMTIIRYENAHNIDIKFENGVVILRKNYSHFKTGQIKLPTIFPNGIRTVEFAYRKDDDWYYVCEHDEWPEQRILPVKEICPEPIMTSKNKTERRVIYGSLVNKTAIASNGMKMTCIADNGSKDITVRFEDGAISEHQRRESFLKGHIRHPSIAKKKSHRSIEHHIGEVYYDKKGRKMTIVEYYSNSNVTIEYEDGTRLENKEYRIIKKGADLYPTTRVGETAIARNGLKMKIIDDTIWHDVHVQFEDGTIVKGCTHAQFDARAIKHPDYSAKSSKHAKARIGLKLRMKNGLMAEIKNYKNASSIDVLFENGIFVKDRDWYSFKECRLGMPRYVGKLFIKEFAYRLDDDWYYIVKHDDCDEDKIMSVREMYASENTDHADIKRQ